MTISDNYLPIKQIGNGSTVNFSYSWVILAESYIRVYLEDVTTGVQTLQILNTDYTLVWDSSGGTVTFAVAPTANDYVIIAREIDINQTVPYRTSKGFSGKVIENSYDKAIAISQDQQDELDRIPKFPIGSDLTDITLPNPDAGKALIWNTGKDGLVNSNDNINGITTAAAASAAAASTSEINASTSETNAANSASTASTAAANAATSAAEAAASAASMDASVAACAASEAAAAISETNAAASAASASISETNATTSETNAATSETNASTSETNAATSETNAANSATEAAGYATDAATITTRYVVITANSINHTFDIGSALPNPTGGVFLNKVRLDFSVAFSGGSVAEMKITDGSNVLIPFGVIKITDTVYTLDAFSIILDIKGKTLKAEFVESDGVTPAIPTAGSVEIMAKL